MKPAEDGCDEARPLHTLEAGPFELLVGRGGAHRLWDAERGAAGLPGLPVRATNTAHISAAGTNTTRAIRRMSVVSTAAFFPFLIGARRGRLPAPRTCPRCWSPRRPEFYLAGVDDEGPALDRHREPVSPSAPVRRRTRRAGGTSTRGTGTRTASTSRSGAPSSRGGRTSGRGPGALVLVGADDRVDGRVAGPIVVGEPEAAVRDEQRLEPVGGADLGHDVVVVAGVDLGAETTGQLRPQKRE